MNDMKEFHQMQEEAKQKAQQQGTAAGGLSATSVTKRSPLPFDSIIVLLQFLATSELIRFISKSGKVIFRGDWGDALKFVVEKRLPFSLRFALPRCNRFHMFGRWKYTNYVIPARPLELVAFDPSGSKVERLRLAHFRDFYLSGVCKKAVLQARCYLGEPDRLYLVQPEHLLLVGEHLASLTLRVGCYYSNRSGVAQIPLRCSALGPKITNILARLHSFTLSTFHSGVVLPAAPLGELALVIGQMSSLKELTASADLVFAATPAVVPFAHPFADLPGGSDASTVLSGLESLCIVAAPSGACEDGFGTSLRAILAFIATRCTQLSQLFLPFYDGETSAIFATIRALPKLLKFGLQCYGVSFDVAGSESSILTVTHLEVQMIPDYYFLWMRGVCQFLSKFPNVESLSLWHLPLDLGVEFQLSGLAKLRSRGALPLLKTFSLAGAGGWAFLAREKSRQTFVHHLCHLYALPHTVDLSQITCAYLADSADFLEAVCEEMLDNSVQRLVFTAKIHDQAADHLQRRIARDRAFALLVKWPSYGAFRGTHVLASSSGIRVSGVKTSGVLQGRKYCVVIHFP